MRSALPMRMALAVGELGGVAVCVGVGVVVGIGDAVVVAVVEAVEVRAGATMPAAPGLGEA